MEKKCLIEGARSDKCSRKECQHCGWNPTEQARRNEMIKNGGLKRDSDELLRLKTGPLKKEEHREPVADQL